jgi:glycosyltransferase involved in cell wall biosynthesis
MNKPLISIIIPTFNSMRYLEACLASVLAAIEDYGNAELILIDNGSTDGTYEYLVCNYGQSARIFQIKHVTISVLRNHGASVARGEYLSFIDSDCVVPRDYFRRAVSVFASIETEAAGNYYDIPESPGWVQDTWSNLNRRTSNTYVPYLFAGNFIVKSAVFRSLGGFDENLVTGEDAEFGTRMTRAGYKIYATPEISALHLGIQRNLAEFFRKHAWHGLGMFGSMRTDWFDKPLLMTFAHLLLSVAGVVNLFLGYMGIAARIALLVLLPCVVPALAAVYRMAKGRKVYRPLRSIFLYFVYFAARLYALGLVISGQPAKKTKSGRAAG